VADKAPGEEEQGTRENSNREDAPRCTVLHSGIF
jgi:hypothetical protein